MDIFIDLVTSWEIFSELCFQIRRQPSIIKQNELNYIYVISHGIGPFFHRELIQDSKQLDLLLKYWSFEKQGVVTRYYKSIFLSHAPPQTIQDSILDAFRTNTIDMKHLLMIGSDNPNINKAVEKLIDAELKKIDG